VAWLGSALLCWDVAPVGGLIWGPAAQMELIWLQAQAQHGTHLRAALWTVSGASAAIFLLQLNSL
jgi:hypothetical protein